MDREKAYKLIEAASKSKLKYLCLNNDIVPEELRFWRDKSFGILDVEKIRKYFEDLVRKGKSKNKRCKLMIVGKENQGKTSLLHYLKEGKSIGKTTKSTDGIDVNLWNIKNNKDDNDENEVIFSTWDFAGQEVIYY
jgi:Ras of Complex, Roc, domain of DAPkinase